MIIFQKYICEQKNFDTYLSHKYQIKGIFLKAFNLTSFLPPWTPRDNDFIDNWSGS